MAALSEARLETLVTEGEAGGDWAPLKQVITLTLTRTRVYDNQPQPLS